MNRKDRGLNCLSALKSEPKSPSSCFSMEKQVEMSRMRVRKGEEKMRELVKKRKRLKGLGERVFRILERGILSPRCRGVYHSSPLSLLTGISVNLRR